MMNAILPIRAASSLLLATLLAAQTESAPSAPAATAATQGIKPHIVVETVGPDGWRARLGVTNVGVMLASEEAQKIWKPQLAPILGAWQMTVGDEQAFDAASKRLLAYGGTMRVAVLLNERGPSNVAVTLEGDKRTDLKEMAAELRHLIEQGIPGEWLEVAVAERKLHIRENDGMSISEPMVAEGRMTLLAGRSDEIATSAGLAQHLASLPLTTDKFSPTSPALRLQFDLHALTRLSDRAGFGWREVSDALGVDQLGLLDVALRAAGPHIELDASLSMAKTGKGLIGALFPDSQGLSGLVHLLPKTASAWKVGRFDCKALYDGIIEAIKASDVAAKPESVRDEINEEVGADIDKDLLANMTDELLVVGSPFQDFDDAEEATWMVAFRLRDDRAFRAAMLKMTKRAKPFLSVSETVEVAGVEMRRYGNMLNYDLWLAAGNGLFVMAAGRDAEDEVAAILQAAKAADVATTVDTFAPFADLKRRLPEGHNGLAHADLRSVLAIPSEWWFDIFGDFLSLGRGPSLSPEDVDEQQSQMRALLKAHNLLMVRTATGCQDRRFHWRLFW